MGSRRPCFNRPVQSARATAGRTGPDLGGRDNGLRPAFHAQFRQDRRDMRLYRRFETLSS